MVVAFATGSTRARLAAFTCPLIWTIVTLRNNRAGTLDALVKIEAVLFDADGVVQTPSADWRPSLAELAGHPERVGAFLAEVFAAEKPCLTGQAEFSTALAEVLARWGIDTPVDEVLEVWTMIEPSGEIISLIKSLDIRCCLATNQQRHRAHYMSHELRYADLFDDLFYSCHLGVMKPSASYFLEVARRLEILPVNLLFLDDNRTNVEAALTVGLSAVVFDQQHGGNRLREILQSFGVDC